MRPKRRLIRPPWKEIFEDRVGHYQVIAQHDGLTHHTAKMWYGEALEAKRKLEEQYPQYRWEIVPVA